MEEFWLDWYMALVGLVSILLVPAVRISSKLPEGGSRRDLPSVGDNNACIKTLVVNLKNRRVG